MKRQSQELDESIVEARRIATQTNSALTELITFRQQMQQKNVRSEEKIEIYITEVNKTLKKVALYKDYKELYNLVVPALEMVQTQMHTVMKEHEQNKEIIRKNDETMLIFAKKHDIIEYAQELRLCAKQSDLDEFRQAQGQSNKELGEKMGILTEACNNAVRGIEDTIKKKIGDRMTKFMAKISREKLSLTADELEQIKMLSENLDDVLRTKAEAKEVTKMVALKTNKADTDRCFQAIDVIHKMVDNISVLLTERLY